MLVRFQGFFLSGIHDMTPFFIIFVIFLSITQQKKFSLHKVQYYDVVH